MLIRPGLKRAAFPVVVMVIALIATPGVAMAKEAVVGPRGDAMPTDITSDMIVIGTAGDDQVDSNEGIFIGRAGNDSVVNFGINSGIFVGGPGVEGVWDNAGLLVGGPGYTTLHHNSGTVIGGPGDDTHPLYDTWVTSNDGIVIGGPGDDGVGHNRGTFIGAGGYDEVAGTNTGTCRNVESGC